MQSAIETYPANPADVLAGLLTRPQLAEQLRCGDRTIIRRERAGMPFISIGMTRPTTRSACVNG